MWTSHQTGGEVIYRRRVHGCDLAWTELSNETNLGAIGGPKPKAEDLGRGAQPDGSS